MRKKILMHMFFLICLVFIGVLSMSNDVPDCPKGEDVIYPHEQYCNLFYTCVDGHAQLNRCGSGMVFNAATEYCDYLDNPSVDCMGKEPFDYDVDGGNVPGGSAVCDIGRYGRCSYLKEFPLGNYRCDYRCTSCDNPRISCTVLNELFAKLCEVQIPVRP